MVFFVYTAREEDCVGIEELQAEAYCTREEVNIQRPVLRVLNSVKVVDLLPKVLLLRAEPAAVSVLFPRVAPSSA